MKTSKVSLAVGKNDRLFCERFMVISTTIMHPRISIEIEKEPITPYKSETNRAGREYPLPGISESIECMR